MDLVGERLNNHKLLITLSVVALLAAGCGSGPVADAATRKAPPTKLAPSASSSTTTTPPPTTAAPTSTTMPITTTTVPAIALGTLNLHGVAVKRPLGWHFANNSTGGSDYLYSWTDPANPAYSEKLDIDLCSGCIASGADEPGTVSEPGSPGEISKKTTVRSPDGSYAAIVTLKLPSADVSEVLTILTGISVAAPTPPPTTTTTAPPIPSCSDSAMAPAVSQSVTAGGATFDSIDQVDCTGAFAVAEVLETDQGQEDDYTVVLRATDGYWQVVDRSIYCDNGSIPASIYPEACESN